NIVGEIKNTGAKFDISPIEGEHILVTNMRELVTAPDMHPQERYNDAASFKASAYEAFKLGILSLPEMAKLDTMYWQILSEIHRELDHDSFVFQELEELEDMLASQYLCNFSIFQSAADTWA